MCRLVDHDDEAHAVAGGQLPHHPEVGRDDHEGADETPERRPVGPEDDGHVAGEIDRADRVGVVVDVGGVQAGFTPVPARPGGFGAAEAHARPV